MSQVAYWGVGLFAVLQFFTGLSMKGLWAWILRFSLAIVLWSAGWFVIAKLHNMLSTETWLSGNYAWTQGVEILSGLTKLISVLWLDSSASYFEKINTAFQQAYQSVTWNQPDLGDLGPHGVIHHDLYFHGGLFTSSSNAACCRGADAPAQAISASRTTRWV